MVRRKPGRRPGWPSRRLGAAPRPEQVPPRGFRARWRAERRRPGPLGLDPRPRRLREFGASRPSSRPDGRTQADAARVTPTTRRLARRPPGPASMPGDAPRSAGPRRRPRRGPRTNRRDTSTRPGSTSPRRPPSRGGRRRPRHRVLYPPRRTWSIRRDRRPRRGPRTNRRDTPGSTSRRRPPLRGGRRRPRDRVLYPPRRTWSIRRDRMAPGPVRALPAVVLRRDGGPTAVVAIVQLVRHARAANTTSARPNAAII